MVRRSNPNRAFSNYQPKKQWLRAYDAFHHNLRSISQPVGFCYPRGFYADKVAKYVERSVNGSPRTIPKDETLDKLAQKQRYPMLVGWAINPSGELFLKVKEYRQSDIVYYRRKY